MNILSTKSLKNIYKKTNEFLAPRVTGHDAATTNTLDHLYFVIH